MHTTIAYHPIAGMAPLAWVASARFDASILHVKHGRYLEAFPGFFVEGAWSGEFADGLLAKADTVFGSGAALDEAGICFVSNTATTDFLFYIERAGCFYVANSLPLLLAELGDELIVDYAGYREINQSILGGLHGYTRQIPTRNGHVMRLAHDNLRVDEGELRVIEKPGVGEFDDYEAYHALLNSRVAVLFQNARAPQRVQPMKIFSTQSKGYDTTAINALAVSYGIDRAFTCANAKEARTFHVPGKSVATPDDDGSEICERLGIPCTVIDRAGFVRDMDRHEHYYWAGIDNNQDFNLHEILPHLDAPTLLLTGQFGELWYPSATLGSWQMHLLDDGLKKFDLAGHGLLEIRLHSGFVQAAIPSIGSRQRRSIMQITESPAMNPWRLGTQYDRPIPRRIAEDAGIPREAFGQKKMATVVELATPNLPISEALRKDFLKTLRASGTLNWAGQSLMKSLQRYNTWIVWERSNRFFTDRKRHPASWLVAYLWTRLTGRALRFRVLGTHTDASLFAYCANKVKTEYAGVLAKADAPSQRQEAGRV